MKMKESGSLTIASLELSVVPLKKVEDSKACLKFKISVSVFFIFFFRNQKQK